MPLELTQREIAIAQGDDPDEFGAGVYDDLDTDQETQVTEAAGDDSDVASEETVSDDPDVSSQDDGAGDDSGDEPADWITDDLKELGSSYGLTPERMREAFRDAGHFRQQARDYDRGLVERNRQSSYGSGAQSGAEKSGADAPAGAADKGDEIPLDPEWFREQGYDDATLALVARLKAQQDALDQINPFLQGLQQQQAAERQQREEQEFHDVLDRMSPDRYGRVKSESGEIVQLPEFSLENRRRVYQAVKTIEQEIAALARAEGREPQLPPRDVLVKRAELYLFGDDIEREMAERASKAREEESQKRLKEAAQQAKRRRPVSGTTKPSRKAKTEPVSEMDEIARIANSPELVKFWNEAQDENG